MRKLVVGIGNPGKEYAKTRHNAGFLFIDFFLEKIGKEAYTEKEKYGGILYVLLEYDVYLFKPFSYVNLSGKPVKKAYSGLGITSYDDLWVVHDDTELPFGEWRHKFGGGHKGHNGIRSIIEELGTRDFHRIRIGIGRPNNKDLASYVLAEFKEEEQAYLPQIYEDIYSFLADTLCL
jgi:PTH1 family peptidyl-tRNA hydrolase